jgi:isoleucyl-tRNA synthetase
LVDDPSTSLLAWTTTPYTLTSNLALCVNANFTYIKIHDFEKGQNFILLEKLLGTVYKEYAGGKKPDPKKEPKFKKVGSFQGKDMVGWRYIPMFDYFTEQVSFLQSPLDRSKLTSSTRTELSESWPTTTSPRRLVPVLSTKPQHGEKTITESV